MSGIHFAMPGGKESGIQHLTVLNLSPSVCNLMLPAAIS